MYVCTQMFVIDVTQEANGSLAKTTPQCNVCQTIPGHKCLPLLRLFHFSFFPSVHFYFTLLLRAPLVFLHFQRRSPPSLFLCTPLNHPLLHQVLSRSPQSIFLLCLSITQAKKKKPYSALTHTANISETSRQRKEGEKLT